MPAESSDPTELKLKINVLVMLVGTLIQSAKSVSVLTREDWLTTIKRVN